MGFKEMPGPKKIKWMIEAIKDSMKQLELSSEVKEQA